jgi:Protein of unknown function (DUF2586)
MAEIDLTVEDGGIGIVAPTSGGMHTVLGHCVGGTANVLKIYSKDNIKGLIADYTGGVAVEAAAFALKNGSPVVGICKTATSVAGATTAVTRSAGGTGTIAVSGTPNDDYSVIVKIIAGGAVATATMQIAIDGDTFAPLIATASTYLIPSTGLTLALSGTFAAGETHSFSSTAPAPNASDIGTALDALFLDGRDPGFLHICGSASTPSAQLAICTAVEAELSSWEDNLLHTFAVMEMPAATDSALATAIASVSYKRVSPCVDFVELVSAIRRTQDKRSSAWAVAPRIASVDPGRDPAERAIGKLRGVISTYRDEEKTPGLDTLGYTTLATYRKRGGVYLKNARIPAGSTSDYQYVVHRRVMDVALDSVGDALFEYIARRLRVDPTTGFLRTPEANSIDNVIGGKLRVATVQPERASAAQFAINRSDNVLSDSTLRGKVAIVPLLYPRKIEATFTFTNPALSVEAALSWQLR